MKPQAMLLAPGAGADRNQATLVAVAESCGLPTERMDFPYRKAGKKAPDKAPVAIAAIRDEVARWGIEPGALILGGRSFGGRMASMAVAEGLPAAGLLLMSYPLHPPGKPDNLRTEHFPRLHVPCLFISGTTDPFGSPDEFDRAVKAIPGAVTQIWLKGAHDMRGQDKAVCQAVREWLGQVFGL